MSSIIPSSRRVRLRGTASDDTTVTSVTVNGKAATGTENWRATVKLKRGINRLRISATDDGGSTSTETVVRLRRPRV